MIENHGRVSKTLNGRTEYKRDPDLSMAENFERRSKHLSDLRAEFRDKLRDAYGPVGVAKPLINAAFNFIWDENHSSGYDEVERSYSNWASFVESETQSMMN